MSLERPNLELSSLYEKFDVCTGPYFFCLDADAVLADFTVLKFSPDFSS